MSRHLESLLPEGLRLVSDELLRGDLARYDEAECAPFLAPVSNVVDLDHLDDEVHAACEAFSVADPRLDAHLAERIHRALPITRNEAADPGVFRYLAVVRHPELVRLRWPYRSLATARTRFWRAGARHDANAFSRWWWGAELTREGADYALTRTIFGRSSLATHLFSRELAGHRPCLEACARVLADLPAPEIERRLGGLGKMLSLRVLETLEADDVEEMLRRA